MNVNIVADVLLIGAIVLAEEETHLNLTPPDADQRSAWTSPFPRPGYQQNFWNAALVAD
jgi:hypothetical protein